MATFRQRGKKWHVEVYRLGQRRGASFDTKRACQQWAAQTEMEITARHGRGEYSATGPGVRTMGDLIDRYLDEVTPTKRGHRNETLRLKALRRDVLARIPLASVAAPDIADWRDRRLREVSPASVARDMNIIVAMCNRAVREWHWLAVNPCAGVMKPKSPPSRDRLISDSEIAALGHAFGYDLADTSQIAATGPQRVMAAALFAIETAMRASEICGLTAGDIKGSVARLNVTKNGYGRDVALSPAALGILARLPPVPAGEPLFGLRPPVLDALWRKYRDKAGITDLHFHDTRHEATTRLAQRMDVMDLARMTGHRDLKMLLRYYHRSAADLALQLASR
jgi:integrase